MIKHKRNEIKKQVEIPVEQIKYDPVKVKERLNKIKKKRAIFSLLTVMDKHNSNMMIASIGILLYSTSI